MSRLGILALLLVGSAAVADPAADGLAWLLAQQSADGSFGGATSEQRVLATAEALETMRAAGLGDTLGAHQAELYLAISPRVPDAEVELRRERALAPTGQAIPLKRRVAHAAGFEHADPLHLSLTLQADLAGGRAAATETFLAMLDLKSRLQPSGCWRWVENDDSLELTASSVKALRGLLDLPTPGLASNGHLTFALDEGARCLRAGNPTASLGATAMALEALMLAPGANTVAIASARATLVSAQAPDGSIGGSVRVTAIAVRGLMAGAPDWRIVPDDFNRPVLALQDPAPLAGVDAVARLTVENRSGTAAPATTVQLFLFSLDFTPPVITVGGVSEGASGTSFTPTFSASDVHGAAVSAALDGAAFISGTTVTTAGAHTLVVTATDGAGNTASVTRHFTVTGGGGAAVPVFHYAVCAFGPLTVSNNAEVFGSPAASVAAHGAFTAQNNARIQGAVVTGGSALLKNNALVDGRVYHFGGYTLQNNALAAGGREAVTPAPAPCECGFDLTAALADAAASNDNALLAGNPAFSNKVLTVQNNGTVTLSSGRYFLQALEVKNNATLKAAPGAQVRLYVQGNVTMGNNSMVGAPVGSQPMLLVSGGATVQLKNNTDAALQLYAPNASVALGNNAKLHGAVVGNAVTLSNNQRIQLTGFTQSTPPPLTCP